jgi:hypothetical protein
VGWCGYHRYQAKDFFERIEEILDGAAHTSEPLIPDAFPAVEFDIVVRDCKPRQVHAAIDDARRRMGLQA